MKPIYSEQLNKMTEYYLSLEKKYRWDNALTKHMIALSHVLNKKDLNINQIEEVKTLIKNETGAFSMFRTSVLTLSGLLSAREINPTGEMRRIIKLQPKLKEYGFKNGTYLPVTLYTVAGIALDHEVDVLSEKAKTIYNEMKSNHPFLTSGDDYALAYLLAKNNLDTSIIETYYQALSNEKFGKSNGLQMLSHLLTYSSLSVSETVEKTSRVMNRLKESKLKLYSDYYSVVGMITLLSENDENLVDDVIEIAQYLQTAKKYKWLGKGMNVMFATAIVASTYIDESKELISTTLSVSIESIIAAQQAAMIAAISASTIAATSAT
jgi:hypothetical protein